MFKIYIIMTTFLLTSCEMLHVTPRNATPLAAAVGGAYVGAGISAGNGQVIAIIGASMLAKHISEKMIEHLDAKDKLLLLQSQEKAYTSALGEPQYWKNLGNGHRGILKPVREEYSRSGKLCREFEHTLFLGYRQIDMTGTACLDENQKWRIVR